MTTESLEELRERLLRQQNVQQMIQVRAYEIYQMRGGKPGGEAQDWFHAQGEVLAFLIASESAQADEQAKTEGPETPSAPKTPPKMPAARKPRAERAAAKPADVKPAAPKKTASKRATPRKPADSTSKSKKTSKQSKIEGNVE